MAAPPEAEAAPQALRAFVDLCGGAAWQARLGQLRRAAASPTRSGRQALQRHSIELVIDRLRAGLPERRLSEAERRIVALAGVAVQLHAGLSGPGRGRLAAALAAGLAESACLVPLFHLLRTAERQRARGFTVGFAGFDDGAPFDLLIARDGTEAEIACDVVSAEAGRGVHRGAWLDVVDRIAPELQAWLRTHPGRHILKLTLPAGLTGGGEDGSLVPEALHARIAALLREQRRSDGDAAAMLRLDPLLLPAANADELGLMPRLRQEFGPEAHLSVTTAAGSIFALAARAGRQNAVGAAIRQRMAAVVAQRLTGGRPGILAMFVEDTDATEWRGLRERLELEGEARQFLTLPAARVVVAVTCASRLELFGLPEPDAAPDGELRFRNQAHPASRLPALAPAVQSSV